MADRSPRSLRSMSDDELAGALTVLAGSIELPGDPGPAFADSVRARLAAQAEGASAIGVARGRRPVARTIDRLRWMPPARRALLKYEPFVDLELVGELHHQNAVLGDETDQRQQTDLGVDVHRRHAEEQRDQRTHDRHRH